MCLGRAGNLWGVPRGESPGPTRACVRPLLGGSPAGSHEVCWKRKHAGAKPGQKRQWTLAPDLTVRSRGSNATTQRPRAEAGPAHRSRGAAFSCKQLQPKYCRISRQKEGSYRFSSTEAAFKILQ